jgi:hypothetical protein
MAVDWVTQFLEDGAAGDVDPGGGAGAPCWFTNDGTVTVPVPDPVLPPLKVQDDGVTAGIDWVVDSDPTRLQCITSGTYVYQWSVTFNADAGITGVFAYPVLNADVGPTYYDVARVAVSPAGVDPSLRGGATVAFEAGDTLALSVRASGGVDNLTLHEGDCLFILTRIG